MGISVKKKHGLAKNLEEIFSTLTENTALAYRIGLKQYRAFLKKRRLADNLRSAKSWLVHIRKTKSAATYNLRARAVRFYFEFKHAGDPAKLWEVQYLTSQRASIIIACHTDNYLTKEQVDQLVTHMTRQMGLITEALFWSGCRISELLNMRIMDIKPSEMAGAVPVTITGKGNKVRTVYLPGKLVKDARQVFRGRKYLFETKNGSKFSRTQVGTEMSHQGKNIGIRVHPHKLRHSKAMYLKDVKKLSADQIAKALGHVDVSTTLKCYFHGTPSALDQGIE